MPWLAGAGGSAAGDVPAARAAGTTRKTGYRGAMAAKSATARLADGDVRARPGDLLQVALENRRALG